MFRSHRRRRADHPFLRPAAHRRGRLARRPLAAQAIVSAIAAALAAGGPFDRSATTPPVHAARLAGISGAGVVGCQVVNLDRAQPATVVVDLYKQGGGAPVSISRPNVPAGAAANFYLPNESVLANGAFAGIFSSDREIRVICRTDWNVSGGAALYEDSPPGTDIVVAPAVKAFGGQTSIVSVQNTDTGQQASVAVDFVARGSAAPAASTTIAIAPGTSATLDLGRFPQFATVPGGTIGHLRIRSSVPVAVQAFVDDETSQRGVYGFQGVPVDQAAERLFAPVVHAAAPVDPGDPTALIVQSSRIDVVNVDGASPASVALAYTGVAGACAGQTYRSPSITVDAGGSATIDQTPPAGPLPAGCTAAAVVEATGGKVVATVLQTARPGGLAAGYNAMRAEDGATSVLLPLWRNQHTAARVSTAFHVMNLGTAPTEATLTVLLQDGSTAACGAACTATIPPGGAHQWWPPVIAALPAGRYGAAFVTADQPLAAVVTDTSAVGAADLASHVGAARGTSGSGGLRSGRRYLPLLLKSGMQSSTPTAAATTTAMPTGVVPTAGPTGTPTPRPRPTTPPSPTPSPTVAAAGGGPQVGRDLQGRVPPAAINQAMADPSRVAGWGMPMNPNRPVGPDNPLRTCLALRNPNQPYHPIFNGLVFKASCP